MTDKSIKSQGTVFAIDTSSTATPTYTAVAGFTNFSGLGGGSRSVIDVTDLSSTAKEKNVGLADEGQCSVELIFVSTDVGQKACQAARGTGAVTKFRITLADNTKYEFSGYVLTFERSAGVDEVVKASLNIEITGAVTTTYPV